MYTGREKRFGASHAPAARATARAAACLLVLSLFVGIGSGLAAGGSPQLALVRAVAYRSSTAAVTLQIEGNFNFEDTVQLPLPVNVIVAQGDKTFRFDLMGHAFSSVAGGSEQPAPGPGVIAINASTILLVLPPGFAAGTATVQLAAQYQGDAFSSNSLEFTL
jgi:hypothetical protein